jgi:4-diphosphocytidyl-2-C-methyl-D-erythritol kinase
MLVFPNCKINLGLRILRKRSDNFHELETVFYPVPLRDALEVIKQPSATSSSITFSASGNIATVDPNQNICVKAYNLLQKDFPHLGAIAMHLHKNIPMGAGLGGGSADGAFALQLLNTVFSLGLSTNQLMDYALQLGSDCPFFIYNQPCFATGRGEYLTPVTIDLSGFNMIIINPGIHISTATAFSQLHPSIPEKSVQQIVKQPIHTWKDELINDFEQPIFEQYPEINSIKTTLYQQGAVYASMSGSGSTVYGIFDKAATSLLTFPSHYFIKKLPL